MRSGSASLYYPNKCQLGRILLNRVLVTPTCIPNSIHLSALLLNMK